MQNEKKTQLYVIIVFGVLSLIIFGVVALFYQINNPNTGQPAMNEYTDPGSGNTIVSPEGKTPEKYGVNPDAPIYIGFSKLLDIGISFDQVNSIKSALGDYAFTVKDSAKITEISLTSDSITHTPNPTGPDTYLFRITMNRKDEYRVIVSAPDISSIELSLYTKDGRDPLFTSKK